MRLRIYNFLVNKHAGIRQRYHKFHDGADGYMKVLSWLYLVWLNFCYYVLFRHSLGKPLELAVYEEKELLLTISESDKAGYFYPGKVGYLRGLDRYPMISFDIFDTLLFRPFSDPTDLFFFIGERLGFMDFKRIRILMEQKARESCFQKYGHTEVRLADIWQMIEQETGIPAEEGMQIELELESRFCYANPFMLEVFREAKKFGKDIVAISDMYLPLDFIEELLRKNGFTGFSRIYISCEYGKSKAAGTLYDQVYEDFPISGRIGHIGDNYASDVQMSYLHRVSAWEYPNVNKNSRLYRPYDMSPVIGGAYRGVVNAYLYNGYYVNEMEYEYGFIYGGIFALGYCNFIHEYCQTHAIDKILFLSRDGDILKQVYEKLYPEEETAYVYWSRIAATKLMAGYNKYDYFRRFLYHKVNKGRTIKEVLNSMELSCLLASLPEKLSETDCLTDKNVERLKAYIEQQWQEVLAVYEVQQQAARDYYADILKGCAKVCAVDIGWAGSGALSLDYLVQHVWKLPCEVIGVIAGTNTLNNAEPDTSEIFLQSGKLVSYLFSQAHNREVMKKHDVNRDYNVYWEILLSSTTRQFRGFTYEPGTRQVKLCFGEADANQEGIKEIQRGILDFVEEYQRHFKDFPYMSRISGRDAYAPMLLAASKKEKYLKEIKKRFELKVDVD